MINSEEIQTLHEEVIAKDAEFNLITSEVKVIKKELSGLEHKYENLLLARTFLQEVASNTQKQLESHISNLVTLALQSVFDNPYEFKVKFVKRRNKTECDLFFFRDGEIFQPIESSGGGELDVASIALRAAFWSLSKTRPILFLDEPGKFVSTDLQPKVASMIRMLADKLGVQFIIVSHQYALEEVADKVFKVKNGIILQGE